MFTKKIISKAASFLFLGIFIIGFFLLQKKHSNLVVNDDENNEFDAEDIIGDESQGE